MPDYLITKQTGESDNGVFIILRNAVKSEAIFNKVRGMFKVHGA